MDRRAVIDKPQEPRVACMYDALSTSIDCDFTSIFAAGPHHITACKHYTHRLGWIW